MKEKLIDRAYLKANPNHIFVFGDNTTRIGSGGAAILRDEPNTYGFVTQIFPSASKGAHYTTAEYKFVYPIELRHLRNEIKLNPDKHYLISRVGGGLANKHGIWEKIIEPRIKQDLSDLPNVEFLWEND